MKGVARPRSQRTVQGMRVAIVFTVLLAACASDAYRAGASYQQATSCPAADVQVMPLPALALLPSHASLDGRWQNWAVSTEAAADPAQYAADKQAVDAAYRATLESQPAVTPDRARLFQVTGCGQLNIVACDASDRDGCQPIGDAMTAHLRLGCRTDRAVQFVGGMLSCTGEPVADQPACVATCAPDDVECPLMCDVAAEQQCNRDGLAPLGLCTPVAAALRTAKAAVDAATQVWGSWSALAQADGCARRCREGGDDQPCMLSCIGDAANRCDAVQDARTCRALALGMAYLRTDVE
jgi:hypothetical protein